jgi:hypothetical protein
VNRRRPSAVMRQHAAATNDSIRKKHA